MIPMRDYQLDDFPDDIFQDNEGDTFSQNRAAFDTLLKSKPFSFDDGNISNSIFNDKSDTTIPVAPLREEQRLRPYNYLKLSPDSQKKEKELQWWMGTIIEVNEETFTARLEDLGGRISIVEFQKIIVSENNQANVKIDSYCTYCVRSRESFTGELEYLTKINILVKQNWHNEYEKYVQDVIDKILPDDLLDL